MGMLDQTILGAAAVGLVVGIVAVVAIRAGLSAISSRGGAFTGTWEQTLTGGRGGMRAKDRVVCRQTGAELRGTIRRVEPGVEDYKEWRFAGHVQAGLVSLVYWGADPQRMPGDFGTLQLALAEPGRAEGLQIKQQVSQDGRRFEGMPLETKLTWARPGARAEARLSAAEAAEARKTGKPAGE
jgi:hypothetical protein